MIQFSEGWSSCGAHLPHHSQCQWSNRTGAKTKKPELLILSLVTNYKKISSQNNPHISLYLSPGDKIFWKPMSQRLGWWHRGGEFKVTAQLLSYPVYPEVRDLFCKICWDSFERMKQWQIVWFLHLASKSISLASQAPCQRGINWSWLLIGYIVNNAASDWTRLTPLVNVSES